jgi:hypothetical protein
MAVANTLAYCDRELIMSAKSFKVEQVQEKAKNLSLLLNE